MGLFLFGNEVYNGVIVSENIPNIAPGGEACIISIVCVPKSFVISGKTNEV